MLWMKGGILALSLALNVYLFTRLGTGTAPVDHAMTARAQEQKVLPVPPGGERVAKEAEEAPPLPEGWLRLSKSEWQGAGKQCFLSDDWALSELAVETFGLTSEQVGLVNQALERMRQQVYLWESERVEKHSDWHYTLGGLTESEVGDLKAAFQEALVGSLDSVEVKALTELTFAHRYFLGKGASWNMEIQLQPYRDHLGIQFGSPQRINTIPYDTRPLVLVGHSKRIAHLIDLEAIWQRAFEETESLRKPSEP